MKRILRSNQHHEDKINTSENAQSGDSRAANARAHNCVNKGKSMAESVTRHALISHIGNIAYLTCGIDSLDVGFYVAWGDNWETLRQQFDDRKAEAQGTEGNLIDIEGIRSHIFYPSGKAPNYRYHVKYPEYHCFISIIQSAKQSPNIYVSFTSEALHWELSEKELIEVVSTDIEALGGNVIKHKISRCDLYADFRIPGGLSLEFLKNHMVGKADDTSHFMKGDVLETFYAGNKSSPIQLRIYDKSAKIKKDGSAERWLLVWFTDDPENVWRIEFQIRRPALKEYRINSIYDLLNQKADLWKYMTSKWFSLRYLDNENQSRRTVHELWEKVQACVQFFGQEQGTKRKYEKKNAIFIKWHLLRIVNLLISCAAILKDFKPESCLMKVCDRILQSINEEEFKEKARKKSIELGLAVANESKTEASDIFKSIVLKK